MSEQPAELNPPARSILRLSGRRAEEALAVLAGAKQPAAPRDAATVMLLRPGTAGRPDLPGIEVYLLRRASSMAFAPGAFVFPGGSVDERDTGAAVAWAGPGAAEWGRLLAAPAALARALVCAAVRETFEESGVLLAGPTADTIVADTRGADWEADRRALLDRTLSLAGLFARRRLVLRSDLLRPWARWVTPVIEARRYDTRFFAAALPPGQRTRDVGGEASAVAWVAPGDAIGSARGGELLLMPPTAVNLAELTACGTVTAALAAPGRLAPVLPEAVTADGAVWLTLPPGVEYPL